MTRYYFNENPQVTQWRKKCEKLQEELDFAIDQLETTACCMSYTEERLEKERDKVKQMARFTSLPWYKKMFFKFEV